MTRISTLATITEKVHIEPYTLPRGFLYASIKNVGGSSAHVNGVELPSGEAKSYPFIGKGYDQVTCHPEQTELLVMVVI